MPDVAISENFGDLLDPRFRKIYTTEYQENIKESMVPMLFQMVNPGKRDNYKVSGVGAMADMSDFDGSITYDSFGQLYDTTIEFPELASGFKVERKLADDELFGIMDGRPRQMAQAVARTREKKGAGIFNEGFTATTSSSEYLSGGDTKPLFSDSHPYSPDDSTTQDNKGASAMTAITIEATRRIGKRGIYNDRGELLDVNYDMIICTSEKEEIAWEVINSKGKVETANNNRNFHYGRYKLAVWDRLSDADNWFMVDSKLMKLFLIWLDRVAPEYRYDRDFDTLVAKWSVYGRWNCWYGDWKFAYGHLVS